MPTWITSHRFNERHYALRRAKASILLRRASYIHMLIFISSRCLIEYFDSISVSNLLYSFKAVGLFCVHLPNFCDIFVLALSFFLFSNDLHFFCDFLLNIIMIHCTICFSLNTEGLDLLLLLSCWCSIGSMSIPIIIDRNSLGSIAIAKCLTI